MEKETNTLNFRIGKGAGQLVTDIAREKVISGKYDIDHGIRVLTLSFIGMTEKQAFKILVGIKKLVVLPATQELDYVDDPDKPLIYHGINKLEIFLQRMDLDCKKMEYYLREHMRKISEDPLYLDAAILTPYFIDNDDTLLKEVIDDTYLYFKDFLHTCVTQLKEFVMIVGMLKKLYAYQMKFKVPVHPNLVEFEIPSSITKLHNTLFNINPVMLGNMVDEYNKATGDLDNYFKANKEIEKMFKAKRPDLPMLPFYDESKDPVVEEPKVEEPIEKTSAEIIQDIKLEKLSEQTEKDVEEIIEILDDVVEEQDKEILEDHCGEDEEDEDEEYSLIKPVDHTEKRWDAGYISPEGLYYALDGDIANMLHNNIADALVYARIIPEDFEDEVTADSYLERKGWVKQHGDHILFSGYDNSKLGKKDVPITKAQLKVIKEIMHKFYGGSVWPGYDPRNRCSVLSWVRSDPLQFRLKWFAL